MSRMRNIIKSKAEYTESFSGFCGLAREGDNSNPKRLAVVENLYRDYEGEGGNCLVSVPGFRRLAKLDLPIRAIYRHKRYGDTDAYVIHAGEKLFHMLLSEDGFDAELRELGYIPDEKSVAFNLGGYLHIVCLGYLYRVENDGEVKTVEPYEADYATHAYVPTIFKNGVPFEPRNVLTNEYYADFDIVDYNEYSYSTPGLCFSVTDEENRLCAVSGIDNDDFEGELHIPGRVKLNGIDYRVSEIADSAFAEQFGILGLYLGEGIERIGKLAFAHCSSLEIVFTPDSLVNIDNGAFLGCLAMTRIFLRSGLSRIGFAAFNSCFDLEYIYYSGDEEAFGGILLEDNCIAPYERIYGVFDRTERIALTIDAEVDSVDAVTVDGVDTCYSLDYRDNGEIWVYLSSDGSTTFNGKKVRLYGELLDLEGTPTRNQILSCTIAEVFDGRVFLSGAPDAPNTVFYSAPEDGEGRGALYFGEYNYFNDGSGPYPVCSMMSVRDSLAVFKSDDDGSGTIFYHKGELTGDPMMPKIYPVSSIHSGIVALEASLNFLDDPVFLTPMGVAALEREQLSYERSVGSRSTNINSRLIGLDLSRAKLLPWMGYLALCVEDKIFLGDPRSTFIGDDGNKEYEWFLISGVKAAYQEDLQAFFHPYPIDDYHVREGEEDKKYNGVRYLTATDSNGDPVYYCQISGVKYRLYITEQRKNKYLSPPSAYMSDGKRLMFGTEDGVICIFNNDRRGIPPKCITERPGFSESVYKEQMGKQIHPYFYSFDCLPPRYALRTVATNCGVPHLTKSTTRGSLVVKYSTNAPADIICEVYTDKGGYSECSRFFGAPFSFEDLNLSKLNLSVEPEHTMVLGEKEKNWIEKSVSLYSQDYECPIKIHSMSFRYKIHGRIKKY